MYQINDLSQSISPIFTRNKSKASSMVRVSAYAYIAINFPYLAFYDYVFQTVIQENSKHIDESRVSRGIPKRICLNDHLIASEWDIIKTFIHPFPMCFATL